MTERRTVSASPLSSLLFGLMACLLISAPLSRGHAQGEEEDSRGLAREASGSAREPGGPSQAASGAALDPAARLLESGPASEYWTLFIDLDSGHRITQRFLLTNAGPGRHTAVAIGHLIEPGRAPYRYENGRRRSRWTLSEDRLFFDIAASHLDLHRPRGELRISKEDVQIQLFFEFGASQPSARVPRDRLPEDYSIDLLAVGAETYGTIRGPWMPEPIETRGRVWLLHTWTTRAESDAIGRRVELFGTTAETAFYGLRIGDAGVADRSWHFVRSGSDEITEDQVHVPARWLEAPIPEGTGESRGYPLPGRFVGSFPEREESGAARRGEITIGPEWLRYDPLDPIPQPFRWFFRRTTRPREVWADARIEVTLSTSPDTPSLPNAGERASEIPSNSNRETDDETAHRSVKGVASITFLNPIERR